MSIKVHTSILVQIGQSDVTIRNDFIWLNKDIKYVNNMSLYFKFFGCLRCYNILANIFF